MLSELDGALWPYLSQTILAAGDPVWSLARQPRLTVNVQKNWFIYIYIILYHIYYKYIYIYDVSRFVLTPQPSHQNGSSVRPWIEDLQHKMTKAQKEELQCKQDASIKMVNKYVDASGAMRVSCPYNK